MSDLAFFVGAIIAAIAFLAALGGVIAVVIVRLLVKSAPPEEILRQRYARGELTREQYEQIRRDLGIVSAAPVASLAGRTHGAVRRWTGAIALVAATLLV